MIRNVRFRTVVHVGHQFHSVEPDIEDIALPAQDDVVAGRMSIGPGSGEFPGQDWRSGTRTIRPSSSSTTLI